MAHGGGDRVIILFILVVIVALWAFDVKEDVEHNDEFERLRRGKKRWEKNERD